MREFLEILRDQTKEERLHNTWFSACGLQRFSKVRGSLKSLWNLIGNCFVIPHDTIPSTVTNKPKRKRQRHEN